MRSTVSRQKVADDLLGRAYADLNVIQLAKARAGIQSTPFQEKAAHGVERLFSFFRAKLMKGFDHRAVEKSRAQFRAAIGRCGGTRRSARAGIKFMRAFDEGERLGFGEVEAMAELDDRAKHGGSFDFGAVPLGLGFRPTQGSRPTILPEIDAVAQPVPGVLTRLEFRRSRHHFFDQPAVAPMVADGEGLRRHQRN